LETNGRASAPWVRIPPPLLPHTCLHFYPLSSERNTCKTELSLRPITSRRLLRGCGSTRAAQRMRSTLSR